MEAMNDMRKDLEAATRNISDTELSLSRLGGPPVNETTLLVCTTGCSS